jgi:hypothetical protein
MVGIAPGLWSVAVWGLLIWLVWSVDGGRPVGWSGQAAHAWVADAGLPFSRWPADRYSKLGSLSTVTTRSYSLSCARATTARYPCRRA